MGGKLILAAPSTFHVVVLDATLCLLHARLERTEAVGNREVEAATAGFRPGTLTEISAFGHVILARVLIKQTARIDAHVETLVEERLLDRDAIVGIRTALALKGNTLRTAEII